MSDICLYVHTGGTTAVPKIISCRIGKWSGTRSIFSPPVLVGAYGTVLITFLSFTSADGTPSRRCSHAGITGILMREFNPGLMLELIHAGRVENFGAVEAMLQFLIAIRNSETDFLKLKAITTAARLFESGDGSSWLKHSHQSDLWNDRGRSFNFAYIPRSDSLEGC